MTLNGPSRIYHLKPVFQLPEDLEPVSSMYKMRNLHQFPVTAKKSAGVDHGSCDQSNISNENPMISEVLRRQEELIKNLKKIQTKVTDLKLELSANISTKKLASVPKKDTVDGIASSKASKKPLKSVSNNVTSPSRDMVPNIRNIVVRNPVINLSPHRPAYSLLTLPHIWPNVFKTNCLNMHIHSSVNEIPKAFHTIKTSTSKDNKENSVFDMRLIWKDVPDTELISSPIKQTPLLGEVSVLRLFDRMFSPVHTNAEHLTVQDSALDVCHQLLYARQKHAALLLVKKLAELLGSHEWMMGESSLGIVDAAAWSAILNSSNLVTIKQLSPSLAKWVQKINSLVGITNELVAQK